MGKRRKCNGDIATVIATRNRDAVLIDVESARWAITRDVTASITGLLRLHLQKVKVLRGRSFAR